MSVPTREEQFCGYARNLTRQFSLLKGTLGNPWVGAGAACGARGYSHAMAERMMRGGRRARSPITEKGPSWGERLRAMRNLPPFLRMVWGTHRGMVAGICALRLLRAFVPIATLWIGKLIVDAVVAAT